MKLPFVLMLLYDFMIVFLFLEQLVLAKIHILLGLLANKCLVDDPLPLQSCFHVVEAGYVTGLNPEP